MTKNTELLRIVHNGMNDIMRDSYREVQVQLENNNLITEGIKTIIKSLIDDVVDKNNKTSDTNKKTRLSGYHLYMREHRNIVKQDQPDITPQQMTSVLAKSWKTLSEDTKQEYNNRAKCENATSKVNEHSESTTDNITQEVHDKPKQTNDKDKQVVKTKKTVSNKKKDNNSDVKAAGPSKQPASDTEEEKIDSDSDIDL
tara:strand:+ start:254 stop:850 length:597 start_codon:yes stop_codon:yes gene_type:complete